MEELKRAVQYNRQCTKEMKQKKAAANEDYMERLLLIEVDYYRDVVLLSHKYLDAIRDKKKLRQYINSLRRGIQLAKHFHPYQPKKEDREIRYAVWDTLFYAQDRVKKLSGGLDD